MTVSTGGGRGTLASGSGGNWVWMGANGFLRRLKLCGGLAAIGGSSVAMVRERAGGRPQSLLKGVGVYFRVLTVTAGVTRCLLGHSMRTKVYRKRRQRRLFQG